MFQGLWPPLRKTTQRSSVLTAGVPRRQAEGMSAAPAPNVWPTLRAHHARALIRFLVDAFGFEETVVYGDGDTVEHAQLSWPEGGGIMLGSHQSGEKVRNFLLGAVFLAAAAAGGAYILGKINGFGIN